MTTAAERLASDWTNESDAARTTRPVSLSATVATTEVWIAAGLRKPWRICSIERTYGEFDRLADAHEFIRLLVLGDPTLRRLA